ncbi:MULTISPECIES: lysozyme inhibitor LprI family protein [unclassified Halomonas]|uniref:lysozyme inhibitor LprI family protein n=1 Tax=unclassified Halomonas TaxID=2609666 RepID=UPI0021E501E2|nr:MULTISPECIES: lysozyme inhibitor LprI family protein [unclassified Halomonas]UYF99196.1 lysozyme inhibitor LprI family protein [Halomonas sp. GD1P12]WNL43012.1 lysozyme inhibitor LprI family protein [Halomonas sp. PAMB 3264]
MKKWLFIVLATLSLSAVADDEALDCNNIRNTLETNRCAAIELEAAEEVLAHYLETSVEHNAADPELVEAIQAAQTQWQAYAAAHCGAVYTQWRDGTIRGVMGITCSTRLTKQRTHDLWQDFLTYMDSTPPVLPEPAIE